METRYVHIGNHVLDIIKLPKVAQQELVMFYQYLLFKYQKQTVTTHPDKQHVLSQIFQEANGILPKSYIFNREALHEQ